MSTIYLTRALISPQTIAARGIRDAYTWHQLVWQAFPGRDGEARDFLTRLDDKQGAAQLIILSPQPPVPPPWITERDVWQTKPIPPGFFQARRYRFQLRANATKKLVRIDENGKRHSTGKRAALTKREDILAWFHRKGEQGGFKLREGSDLGFANETQRFTKSPRQGRAMKGTHGVVDLLGELEVTDPALFHTALAKGIGTAKAFGFGLLVLAPA